MNKFLVPALSVTTMLAVTYGSSARAQEAKSDADVGEVVVTSQKLQEGSIGGWIPVPLPELPRTVTIIDEELISKQFVGSTKDIIKNVAGVQIMPDNNLAGYQTPYIRGIQSSQYMEGQYSAGVITSVPEVIGGAEVLQGFNSLQFAIDTGGGSVNYFLKRPTGQNFLQTELQGTNWGGAKFVVDGNMHMGPGDTDGIRVIGVVDRDQSYVRGFPRKEGNSAAIMGRYSGILGIQIDVDLSIWDIDNDPNNQFIAFGSAPVGDIPDIDPRTNLTQKWSETANRKGHQLGLRLSKEFGNWRALMAVAYDRTSYVTDGCNQDTPNFETGEVLYYCSRNGFGPLWDKQIRFDLSGKVSLFGMDHQMAIGFRQSGQDWKSITDRYSYSWQAPYDHQNLYNPRQYPRPTDADTRFFPASNYRSTFDDQVTYFQDRISFNSKWDLWAGVGYVANDGFHGVHGENDVPNTYAVVPTGALMFKPTQGQHYYFSYSEGVSRAEVTDPTNAQLVNPGELIPAVHSKAYEVGAKFTYADRLFVNVAVFDMEQPYVIQEDVGGGFFRRYAGGLNEFKGVSVDFRGKLSRSLSIQGGITALDPKQSDSVRPELEGNRSAGVANRSAAINLDWDVGNAGGLTVDGGVYYQNSMPLDVENTYELDGFTRFDLGASYETEWNENKVRYRLLLENALDDEFYYGFQNGIQLAAPRTLNASVAVRF